MVEHLRGISFQEKPERSVELLLVIKEKLICCTAEKILNFVEI
jgi:hypothetical protein